MVLCMSHNHQGEYFKRSFLLKDLHLDDHDDEFSAEEEGYDSDCEEVEQFSLPISGLPKTLKMTNTCFQCSIYLQRPCASTFRICCKRSS